MRRSAWFRVLSIVLGLWFSTAVPLSAAVHDCPLHGNHGAHAGHEMAGMHHAPADAPGKAHHTSCTCLGSCCCAAAVAAPATGVRELPSAVRSVAVASDSDRNVASRREHALPFSNGPPVPLS